MKLLSLKKWSILLLFGLSFLTHFLYEWFPNNLFAIFFPVNESIWEHMKMLYTTIILYGGIEYFILRKLNLSVHNYLFSVFVSAICSIPIYLILFLPFYQKGFHQMIFYFIIMLITYAICSCISYYIMTRKQMKYQSYISVGFIIFGFIILGYLTYHPLKNSLFFDPQEEKYGLYDYTI